MTRIGVVALARSTFDVDYAEEVAAAAFAALDGSEVEVVGSRDLLFDADATAAALGSLRGEELDLVLVMQVTFTDASMAQMIAAELSAPIVLWAFPEERTGGRLRLNSFCGINLAAHALAKQDRDYRWMYAAPEQFAAEFAAGFTARSVRPTAGTAAGTAAGSLPIADTETRLRAMEVRDRLAASRIGVIGSHPEGFVPCEYDDEALAGVCGVQVDQIDLDRLFDRARSADPNPVRTRLSGLKGLAAVDQNQLERTLALFPALEGEAADHGWVGMAVRCWPESFTEYGAATCGAAALLNDDLLPTACEADVYGSVTALTLQWLADSPALVADLVDIDLTGDTGVFWHCGKAPLSMADPATTPAATIHSNRRMPLLFEFPLRPGRVTIARLSQSGGIHRLVIGGGEMVRAPLAFSGTAGVVRFDRDTADVATTILGEGLEHHYGLVYGDVRKELVALADVWGIPTVTL